MIHGNTIQDAPGYGIHIKGGRVVVVGCVAVSAPLHIGYGIKIQGR